MRDRRRKLHPNVCSPLYNDRVTKHDRLVVSGAREHNLKDIDVSIPRDALTVITGLSGSGKSSLAFDTIYAEGQRRYVESLSAYARQFLGQMDKPDVDSIEGLSPAISIDQKTTSRNPRSTVGTVTEIYDYLRLLWSRVGNPHCHVCGAPIAGQSVEQIVDQVMELDESTRFMVMAPIVRGRKGEYGKLLDELRTDGYARVKVNGELRLLEEPIELDKKFKHDISVVVDRLVMRHDVRKRLVDSVETAVGLADGIIEIELLPRDGTPGETLQFSERFACLKCGTSMPELEPRIFSFNSPHGACERCTGLGSQREIDPDLIVPDAALSIAEGALAPWATSSSNYYEQITEAIADRYHVDVEVAWRDLPGKQRDLFLYGTNGEPVHVQYRNRYGRQRSYQTRFEGIIPNLERRYRETDSEFSREKIEEYMSVRPCPACHGARLRPESRAVLVGGLGIHEFVRLSVHGALRWLDEVQLTETERHIARLILREIEERLRFLENVGIGYLSMDRAAATLSGGEAQRIRLATQIGSSLVGVLYILDEPSIGLHQRDNSKLIRTLERLRDLGNTVIVVEHDEQTMRAADHVIDMGPGAGEHGGEVVAEGTAADIERVKRSLTGQFLARTQVIEVPAKRRKPSGHVEIRGAAQNNLKSVDVRVPLGVLTAVTGVSGSGKSTLVNEVLFKAVANRLHRARVRPGRHTAILGLDQLDKIIQVDQSPI
ncbi:MAG: excinuclease ABC subunit UvrA, partial [Solirubrobacterales bacterium]|nr:excinuclease ABC subunit UvrA [Solirubrobacterales bacterium]